MNMKKQLLILALISATQTMPWNPFRPVEVAVVGAVETPGVVLAGQDYNIPEERSRRPERRRTDKDGNSTRRSRYDNRNKRYDDQRRNDNYYRD